MEGASPNSKPEARFAKREHLLGGTKDASNLQSVDSVSFRLRDSPYAATGRLF